MTHALSALLFTLLVGTGGVDTTLAVRRGTRLEVDNFAGDIKVRTWSRDALRIEASHSRRTRVDIDRAGAVIRLTAVGRMMPGSVDYALTVPAWMPLDLHGMSAEIDVDGTRAAVTAKSINGDVRIKGGEELITASSLQGEVEVEDAHGRVEVSSTNQGVKLRRIDGDVLAESMNGMILLDKVEAKSLEASTVNGSIVFVGPMLSGGVYSLSTHNGTVLVGLSERPDVTVSVATFSGDFSSSIPLSLDRGERHGKRFNFTLGSGSAKLDLESFQGGVHLARLEELLQRLPRIEAQSGDDDEDRANGDGDRNDDTPKHKGKHKDKE
ncbi:MAG: hypothetical protein E6K80_02950 [Candidatus Eisenbacteria bacterium]|uniref:DUF4097 domain-containing protein n=1 Tax=Eiseniibacteriota bacterium TaxID=2212470 RepID=A0A538U9I4_UNCEI|nr:MAG: hypothetical protein E6K80_02950 [Candidatus Eisenbacteria bacterium]